MAVTAYILIQTEVGSASGVVNQISQIEGIVSCDDVTGPYDVIAKAQAGSLDELGKIVAGNIQLIKGITRTLTCPIVNMD